MIATLQCIDGCPCNAAKANPAMFDEMPVPGDRVLLGGTWHRVVERLWSEGAVVIRVLPITEAE